MSITNYGSGRLYCQPNLLQRGTPWHSESVDKFNSPTRHSNSSYVSLLRNYYRNYELGRSRTCPPNLYAKASPVAKDLVDSIDGRNHISSLLGVRRIIDTLPERCLLTLARMCGLPATNMRALGDPCGVWLGGSGGLAWPRTTHSSRASMHMNVCFPEVKVCRIFTISASYGPRPAMAFL